MKMLSVEELKIKTWNRVDDCTFSAMDCENEISLSVHVYFEHGNGSPIFTDSIICDGDILGLFPEEEPKGELESFFEGDDMTEVIERFKEKFPKVYGAIIDRHAEYVINNLDEYDIPNHVREDIADSWIEDNPSEAFDKAKDCVSDSEVRDFVKDYISDNL